jgi:hypothetical protein
VYEPMVLNWLHQQRAHVSLLADPPVSQVSGELLFSWNAIKLPPVGGEKCSRRGRFSGGAGVEGGGEVGAEIIESWMKLMLVLE